MFNVTFNNISVISWLSVLLIEENRSARKKTTDLLQVTDKLYHIMKPGLTLPDHVFMLPLYVDVVV